MSAGARRLRLLLSVCLALASAASAESSRLNPGALFSAPGIGEVSVSPSGDWIAARGWNADVYGILVQHRGDKINVPVYRSTSAISSISWIDGNTLFVESEVVALTKRVALRFEWNGDTVLEDQLDIRKPGHLVDPLPQEENLLLWAEASGRASLVKRRSVDSLGGRWNRSGERNVGETEVVAKLREQVLHWITDRDGVVRAAFSVEGTTDPELFIHYRAGRGKRWREVWRGSWLEDPIVEPLAVTAEGDRLIVTAHGDRDTLGLYEFDPEARALGDVIFQRPDVDVVNVRFDPTRAEIIAAVYHEGGDERCFYLDAFREAHLPDIDALGLGPSVMLTSSSRDYRFLTLLVRSARNPGSFYFLDKETGELTRIGEANFEVRPQWLASTDALRVESEDGTQLDVFLTRPDRREGRLPPMVVLPHGGPIGVRDSRSFDPLSQFIAAAGIAVLKVNYRGSGGYGRRFEEAGWREWGKGIEDDIDAAVQFVIDAGLVDPQRICIAGMSYGGYSALTSAIRHPDRYRCVATIAGVTDIPLLFTSSDFASWGSGRKQLSEMAGDLERDYEQLVAVSPVYHVDELEAPVLIIHGTRDQRVDPEHAYRLRAMLALYQKTYQWYEVRGAGHGFNPEQWHRVAWLLREFLNRYLGGEADGRTAP